MTSALRTMPARDEVPLVDDDDGGPSGLVRVARDVRVLGGRRPPRRRPRRGRPGIARGSCSAMTTASFSSASVTRPLRRMPAVSTRTYGASLVARAACRRRRASCPGASVDEHALVRRPCVHERRLARRSGAPRWRRGRPLRASRLDVPGAGRRSRRASSSSATPRPCSAETGSGSPTPRR